MAVSLNNPFAAPATPAPSRNNPFLEAPASAGPPVASLPRPEPTMFAQMDDQDALDVYTAYARHPKSQIDQNTGDVIYDGIPVPRPEGNTGVAGAVEKLGQKALLHPLLAAGTALMGQETPMDSNILGAAGGGVMNAAREAVVSGASLASETLPGEMIGNQVIPGYREAKNAGIQTLDENLPEFNPEGTGEAIASQGAQIGAGIALGNRAMTAAREAGIAPQLFQSVMQKKGKFVRFLSEFFARGMASGAGTAATVSEDSDTLLVGENSLINLPILQGLERLPPNEAQQQLAKRLDILIDSMIVAAPIETLGAGGKKLFQIINDKYFKPVIGAFSESKKEQIVMQELMKNISDAVNASGDPEKAAFYQNKVIEILKNDKNLYITGSAGKEGISDINVKVDTATAIQRGLADDTSEEAEAIKNLFAGKRRDVMESPGGHVQTETATNRPIRATERYVTEGEEAFGGPEAVEGAREGLQTYGENRVIQSVQDIGDPVGDAQKVLRESQEKYVQDVAQKTDLGKGLVRAEDEPFSETFIDRNRLTNQILAAEETGTDQINKTAQNLLKKIPRHVQPGDGFEEALQDAIDLQIVDKKALSAFQKAGVAFDPEDMEIIDRGSLRELQKVRPMLQTMLRKTDDEVAQRTIKKLIKSISKGPDAESNAALKEYIKYETQTVVPVTRQGLPKELGGIREKLADDLPKMRDTLGQSVDSAMKSRQPAVIGHFVDTLARPEYGKHHKKIVEYVFADVVDQLRDQIKSGKGITEIDPSTVMGTLKTFRQALGNKKFADELVKLDELEQIITKHKGDIKTLEAKLRTKAGDPKAIREEIYGNILQDFFTSRGIRKPNAYESFKSLFTDKQATGTIQSGRLDELIEIAKKEDPVVLDGMRSAWFRLFKENISNTAPDATSNRSISAAKASEVLSGNSQIMTVGHKLFGDGQEQILTVLTDLLDPALNVTTAKRVPAFKGASDPASAQAAKQAITRSTTIILGYLTRKGAITNNTASTVIDYLNPNDKAIKIADAIMADADNFLSAYERAAASTPKDTRGIRDMFNWLVKSGLYNEGDWNAYQKAVQEGQESIQTKQAIPE